MLDRCTDLPKTYPPGIANCNRNFRNTEEEMKQKLLSASYTRTQFLHWKNHHLSSFLNFRRNSSSCIMIYLSSCQLLIVYGKDGLVIRVTSPFSAPPQNEGNFQNRCIQYTLLALEIYLSFSKMSLYQYWKGCSIIFSKQTHSMHCILFSFPSVIIEISTSATENWIVNETHQGLHNPEQNCHLLFMCAACISSSMFLMDSTQTAPLWSFMLACLHISSKLSSESWTPMLRRMRAIYEIIYMIIKEHKVTSAIHIGAFTLSIIYYIYCPHYPIVGIREDVNFGGTL